MDKNRLIGAAKHVMGSAKEVMGKLVGDVKLQMDGKADQIEGKVQNAIGSAKNALIEKLVGKAKQQANHETVAAGVTPNAAIAPKKP